MKRDALQKMIRWKENPQRMPLLLIGARQVGKTWLMREFGERNYEEVAYLSFDRSKDLRSVFEQGFDVARLLANIRLATGRRVMPQKTLIILDEIQECPAAITSLKYFCEDAPEYHVVAAGSLLGLYAQEGGTGFPVGKVDMLDLYPMSFTEFLEALGEGAFVEVIRRHDWELLRTFSPRLEELLRYYYYVGGMPKAVEDFSQNRDFIAARERQISILRGYRRDFGKHASASETRRITEVWDSIPNYLAQEKKDFKQKVDRRERPVQWLHDAGLVHGVSCVRAPQMPLGGFLGDSFKLYTTDVGLLSAQCRLPGRVLVEGNSVFGQYKGALTEQYVMQQLLAAGETDLFYWKAPKAQAEIDFLLQGEQGVVPVEVKAERNLKAKSLQSFCKRFGSSLALRCSMGLYGQSRVDRAPGNAYTLIDVPLWAAGEIPSIIEEFARRAPDFGDSAQR